MKALINFKIISVVLSLFSVFSSLFSQEPTISYIIPDIGAPDMNTYVEIIGPYNEDENFGTDGIYLNNSDSDVRVVCANPDDSNKIVVGPCVVSWNGKMISTNFKKY